jgi:tetratricopeptide (TPR) repeat protein
LFVNLRGFHPDPGKPPVDAAAVLNSFLGLLGVPGHAVPNDLDGRTKLFREQLIGCRALIVLDNAAGAAQIRALLPATPGCLVLITSRHALTDVPGAQHLRLDVFTDAESLAYLRATVGAGLCDADPVAAADIVRALGHLPLALALTAGRITAETDTGWTLADHLQRIRERLQQLRLDDGVEVSLSLSYDDLSPDHRRTLRLLALHPGADLDIHAAAALADADVATAQHLLDHLVANHLLQHKARGRYELHDLVRAYAGVRSSDSDRNRDRRAALTRLVQHYLHTACRAMDLVYPYERHSRPRIAAPATAPRGLADDRAAREWLDTEHANLLAVATAEDAKGHAVAFSAMLWRHLVTVARYADAQTLHRHAVATARARGDLAGQAGALKNLGFVYARSGQHEQAADSLSQALRLFVDLGDRDGQARTLNSLGIVSGQTGSYARAADHFEQAFALFRELGDQDGQTMALLNVGEVFEQTGRYEQAIDHLLQALALGRELGDRDGQACALTNLGTVYVRTGRYEQAADHHQQAVTLFGDLGDPRGQAMALTNLGKAHHHLGRLNQATDHHQRALAFFVDLGDPRGQAIALNGLGETARATGDLPHALTAHTEALKHATEIGDRPEQARAHAGLGHAHHPNHPHQASGHWQKALALYDELGIPEAAELRDHLATLDNGVPRRGV